MPTFIMSTPPITDRPIDRTMCDLCGRPVEEWIAARIIGDLVHICSNCVSVLVKADHEMRRQWAEWRENSDYAPRA